jgi:excinuclease ABC subunit A
MEESDWMRLADSVNTAFYESEGECVIQTVDGRQTSVYRSGSPFNNRFRTRRHQFPEPTPQLFNYNNPYGACPTCEGYGRILGIDRDKVVPDKTKSVYDGAVAPGKEKNTASGSAHFGTRAPLRLPGTHALRALSKEQKLLWSGNQYFEGIDAFFKELESKTYKIKTASPWPVTAGKTVPAIPATAGACAAKRFV